MPFPPPQDLPDPASLTSPALAGRFFTPSATWEAPYLTMEPSFFIIAEPTLASAVLKDTHEIIQDLMSWKSKFKQIAPGQRVYLSTFLIKAKPLSGPASA